MNNDDKLFENWKEKDGDMPVFEFGDIVEVKPFNKTNRHMDNQIAIVIHTDKVSGGGFRYRSIFFDATEFTKVLKTDFDLSLLPRGRWANLYDDEINTNGFYGKLDEHKTVLLLREVI